MNALRNATLDDLVIDDEASFRHVELYDRMKQLLRRTGYTFRAPPRGAAELSWDRAVFLNLTYWHAAGQGDVLVNDRVSADVVVHVGWHHAARLALGDAAATADGMLLGEAIASASDVYLVGRLLGHAPDSEFLATQVPAMADVAESNGMSTADFEAELERVARDPERAFEDLRALLFDAARGLAACRDVDAAAACLGDLSKRRFAPLLHRFELSNWVLHTRAFAAPASDATRAAVTEVDLGMRSAGDALAWLDARWALGVAGGG